MNSKKDIGERIALLRRKRNQKILAIKAFKEKTPGAAQKKWSEIKTGKQDATIFGGFYEINRYLEINFLH